MQVTAHIVHLTCWLLCFLFPGIKSSVLHDVIEKIESKYEEVFTAERILVALKKTAKGIEEIWEKRRLGQALTEHQVQKEKDYKDVKRVLDGLDKSADELQVIDFDNKKISLQWLLWKLRQDEDFKDNLSEITGEGKSADTGLEFRTFVFGKSNGEKEIMEKRLNDSNYDGRRMGMIIDAVANSINYEKVDKKTVIDWLTELYKSEGIALASTAGEGASGAKRRTGWLNNQMSVIPEVADLISKFNKDMADSRNKTLSSYNSLYGYNSIVSTVTDLLSSSVSWIQENLF